MPFQVTIKPSGHTFAAADGETILDGALREGFNIAYGCRDGACGSCKGKVLDGTVDYGDYSDSALPEDDKAKGYALFCQAKPDRKSTRLNSSHVSESRMPSSA